MKKNGSTILMFVIISSIILIYYTNLWHSSSLMSELSYKKYEYEKRFRLTESLYNYCLLICINSFDVLANKSNDKVKKLTIYNAFWPPNLNNYNGFAIVNIIDKNKIQINTTIAERKTKESISINAILEVEEINEQVEGGKKKKPVKKFVVSNWQVS